MPLVTPFVMTKSQVSASVGHCSSAASSPDPFPAFSVACATLKGWEWAYATLKAGNGPGDKAGSSIYKFGEGF